MDYNPKSIGDKMCFKRNKKQPVRLEKKENKINKKEIINLLKNPNFWIIVIGFILIIIAIDFAIKESISSFVYNNGGLF